MTRSEESLASLMERVAKELLVAVQRLRENSESPVAPQWAIERAEKGICLASEKHVGLKMKRGQCVNCHSKTMRRIKSGRLSEATLIANGKLLPAGTGGRKGSDFPLDELAVEPTTEEMRTALKKAQGDKQSPPETPPKTPRRKKKGA